MPPKVWVVIQLDDRRLEVCRVFDTEEKANEFRALFGGPGHVVACPVESSFAEIGFSIYTISFKWDGKTLSADHAPYIGKSYYRPEEKETILSRYNYGKYDADGYLWGKSTVGMAQARQNAYDELKKQTGVTIWEPVEHIKEAQTNAS